MPVATKTSMVDAITSLYDQDGNGSYVYDADNADEARGFAESLRRILKEEGSTMTVEQRNSRVLMTIK